MPEKVQELDVLIDRFIEDTDALVPIPNPAYRIDSSTLANTGKYAGLVPKMCSVSVNDGVLTMAVDPGKHSPFLGTGKIKHKGSMVLRLRVRSKPGGAGQVRWSTVDNPTFSENDQSVTFELTGGNQWQDLRVDIPVHGISRTVRLYLPAEEDSVDIASIQFVDPTNQASMLEY